MRPLKILHLGGKETPVEDVNLLLELSAAGRGFITALTTQDCHGQLVTLDVGYPGRLYRWFTGYVERCQQVSDVGSRLFVRELAGCLDGPLPCAFQHPTLRTVTDWLQGQTGLRFHLPPGADYTDTPAAHLTHAGTGWQLLSGLGRTFGIADYVWQCLPDGGVFLGAFAHSLLADRPVTLGHEVAQETAGADTLTLPMAGTLRPGVVMNGHRLSRVTLNGDDMTVSWMPVRADGQPVTKTPFRRQLEQACPELAGDLHVPRTARVVAHTEAVTGAAVSDAYRPRYAVDIQMLDADGQTLAQTPVFRAVPLPVPMAGHDSGMFQYPPVGSLVEVAFMDGRPDKPFIRQTLPGGCLLAAVKPGEQLQQQRPGVASRVTQEGHMERQTDQAIRERSLHRDVTSDTEKRSTGERHTTVTATDTTHVAGASTLMAGRITQGATGDHSTAVRGSKLTDVAGDIHTECAGELTEQIEGLRRSVAKGLNLMAGSRVHVGSEGVNVLQMLLEMADLLKALAQTCASHSHPNTSQSSSSGQFTGTAAKAGSLRQKYEGIIA